MQTDDIYYSTIDNLKKSRNIIHLVITAVFLALIVVNGYLIYSNFSINGYVKIFFFDCILYIVYKIISLIVFKQYNKKIFNAINEIEKRQKV